MRNTAPTNLFPLFAITSLVMFINIVDCNSQPQRAHKNARFQKNSSSWTNTNSFYIASDSLGCVIFSHGMQYQVSQDTLPPWEWMAAPSSGASIGGGLAYDGSKLWCSTPHAVYNSTDYGSSWKRIRENPGEGGRIGVRPQTIFMAGNSGPDLLGGVDLCSSDGGITWIDTPWPEWGSPQSTVLSDQAIFISNLNNNVFVSSDFGKTWRYSTKGTFLWSAGNTIFNYYSDYKTLSFALHRTTDNGLSWTLVGSDLVVIDIAARSDSVFVLSDIGISLVNKNGTLSTLIASDSLGSPTDLFVDSENFYTLCPQFVSTISRNTLTILNKIAGYPNAEIGGAITVLDSIWLLASSVGIYRSTDRGLHWNESSFGIDDARFITMANLDKYFVAKTQSGRFYSYDSTIARWNNLGWFYNDDHLRFLSSSHYVWGDRYYSRLRAVVSNTPSDDASYTTVGNFTEESRDLIGTFYVTQDGHNVYASLDEGATFSPIDVSEITNEFGSNALARRAEIHVVDSLIFLSKDTTIFQADLLSKKFTRCIMPKNVQPFDIARVGTDLVLTNHYDYGGTSQPFVRSTDNGRTWLTCVWSFYDVFPTVIYIAGEADQIESIGNIVLASTPFGLLCSYDNCTSWKFLYRKQLAWYPFNFDENNLYLAPYCGGLLKLPLDRIDGLRFARLHFSNNDTVKIISTDPIAKIPLNIGNSGNDTLVVLSCLASSGARLGLTYPVTIPPRGIIVDTLEFEPGKVANNKIEVEYHSNSVKNISIQTINVSSLSSSGAKGLNTVSTIYSLSQNYPNPFNPSTTIRYGLPTSSRVSLRIYNILGQQVADLVSAEQSAGWYETQWNATVPSGLYFCRIDAVSTFDPNQRFTQLKKMMLIK